MLHFPYPHLQDPEPYSFVAHQQPLKGRPNLMDIGITAQGVAERSEVFLAKLASVSEFDHRPFLLAAGLAWSSPALDFVLHKNLHWKGLCTHKIVSVKYFTDLSASLQG